MAQKVQKMPENGQKSCTKENNGSKKTQNLGWKSTKQNKLLCLSYNFMFDFNLETLGFKRYIYFTLKIGNLKKNYLAQSDIIVLFLFHFSCFTIHFVCNLNYF